jgi:hypothetical protein
MKSFKELREDTLFLEYSTMMENHPFNEFTTEELLDIVLDDDIYEGHRFNALYVLSNSREEELNETYELEEGIGALLGLGGAAFKLAKSPALRAAAQKGLAAGKSVISKGWEKAKGLFGKKPSGKTPETAPKPSARRPSLQPPEAPKPSKTPEAPKPSKTSPETPEPPKAPEAPKPTKAPEAPKPSKTPEAPKPSSPKPSSGIIPKVVKYGAPAAAGAYLYNKANKSSEAGETSSKGGSSSAMDKPVSPGGMSSKDIHKGISDLASQDPDTKAAVNALHSIKPPTKADSLEKEARDLLKKREEHTGIETSPESKDSLMNQMKKDPRAEKTMQNFVDMQKKENERLGVKECVGLIKTSSWNKKEV